MNQTSDSLPLAMNDRAGGAAMIGVTIGVGEKYARMAALAAASCEQSTGWRTSIVREAEQKALLLKKPHHLKFFLFDLFPQAEWILYFDADTVFIKAFSPLQHVADEQELIAVGDFSEAGWIRSDAARIGISSSEYFNSGLMLLNRRFHAPMLRLARCLIDRIESGFHDQTYLNAARAWLGIPVRLLPRNYNHLCFEEAAEASQVVIGHFHWLADKCGTTQERYYQFWAATESKMFSLSHRPIVEQLLSKAYIYERIDHDVRTIRFRADGTIGEGAARCETRWRVTEEGGTVVLWLTSDAHPTCALTLTEGTDIWDGAWLHHERMRVRLRPVRSSRFGVVKPVEVVILNWRRPENVVRILEAFDAQKAICRVTVIDAAFGTPHALSQEVSRQADRHFGFGHNYGAVNRFMLTLGYTAEYTYFHDDDLLPGPNAIEHLLNTANQTDFSVLGQFGRILAKDGSYRWEDVARKRETCVQVDFLVRAYFVRTTNLFHLFPVIQALRLELQHCEDDLLLCCALNLSTGKPCLITPDAGKLTSLGMKSLPEPSALAARKDHLVRRYKFLEKVRSIGWEHMRQKRNNSSC